MNFSSLWSFIIAVQSMRVLVFGKPELPVSDNCFVSLSWPIIGKTELHIIRFIGKLSAA